MNGTFRPFERLVEISILGRPFLVPERSTLLRCFQFISPDTIPYARFCWNQECDYCAVKLQLPDDDAERQVASCQFMVSAGINITALAPELQNCLHAKLGEPAPASVSAPACSQPAQVSS
jgi:hypothetical protein